MESPLSTCVFLLSVLQQILVRMSRIQPTLPVFSLFLVCYSYLLYLDYLLSFNPY